MNWVTTQINDRSRSNRNCFGRRKLCDKEQVTCYKAIPNRYRHPSIVSIRSHGQKQQEKAHSFSNKRFYRDYHFVHLFRKDRNLSLCGKYVRSTVPLQLPGLFSCQTDMHSMNSECCVVTRLIQNITLIFMHANPIQASVTCNSRMHRVENINCITSP